MTDTFFTRSGSSPGTRNLTNLEILADSILFTADCTLVAVLHNQRPLLVLFRANNDSDLHVMHAAALSHRNILRKLAGEEVLCG